MTTTAMIGSTTTTQAGDLANQATAVRPPKVTGQDVDLLNPESMMAFFQLQMSDVRQKLGVAMQDQQRRNDIIKTLNSLQSDLAKYKEKGIGPDDPGYANFQAKAQEARALLGNGIEGTAVGNLLDGAKGGGTKEFKVTGTYDAAKAANDYAAARPGSTVTAGNGAFVVTDPNLPKTIAKEDIDSVIGQIKGYADSLTADNQMNMIRVQQFVETSSQLTNLCSNIMKKISDSAMAPINNMR